MRASAVASSARIVSKFSELVVETPDRCTAKVAMFRVWPEPVIGTSWAVMSTSSYCADANWVRNGTPWIATSGRSARCCEDWMLSAVIRSATAALIRSAATTSAARTTSTIASRSGHRRRFRGGGAGRA